MNRTEPPPLATWMLKHLTNAEGNEALTGDLLEEFRAGRSNGWYWRQIITAIVIEWMRGIFDHRIVLLFAAIWSMLSPAWNLTITRVFWESSFIGHIWRIPWPWSTVCVIGLSTVEGLLFVWVGALVCVALLLIVLRRLDSQKLGRGFAMSILGYVAATACDVVLAIIPQLHHPAHVVDWRTLTLFGVVTQFGTLGILQRFPYLVGTACALWGAVSKTERPVRLTE